ncbi:MAG: phosphoribosylaminoimidazolesuccinocarboxamide synthase [Alphaproteobacteria bacterium]|nr:phosphoribosylaminoimidazolesuccinocarboxamide synthase [Alphaproteobacteria bacterium]
MVWASNELGKNVSEYIGIHKLYEGKAKILYEGPEAGTVVQYFKDDATAFNNLKKAVLADKGILNNFISEHIMHYLQDGGIPTHFVKRLNDREQLVKVVEIVPIEVVIRNVAAGSLCKRLGIEEGLPLKQTLLEYCYKNDAFGDPVVGESHIVALGWSSAEELKEIERLALKVNQLLSTLFIKADLTLVDFKLEFGRLKDPQTGKQQIILADEVSPDTCRLWDVHTQEKMDKDRFRRDLGNVVEAYQEVAKRLGVSVPQKHANTNI